MPVDFEPVDFEPVDLESVGQIQGFLGHLLFRPRLQSTAKSHYYRNIGTPCP
jgi:hypothetical protein